MPGDRLEALRCRAIKHGLPHHTADELGPETITHLVDERDHLDEGRPSQSAKRRLQHFQHPDLQCTTVILSGGRDLGWGDMATMTWEQFRAHSKRPSTARQTAGPVTYPVHGQSREFSVAELHARGADVILNDTLPDKLVVQLAVEAGIVDPLIVRIEARRTVEAAQKRLPQARTCEQAIGVQLRSNAQHLLDDVSVCELTLLQYAYHGRLLDSLPPDRVDAPLWQQAQTYVRAHQPDAKAHRARHELASWCAQVSSMPWRTMALQAADKSPLGLLHSRNQLLRPAAHKLHSEVLVEYLNAIHAHRSAAAEVEIAA
ncbi:hypothetical protein CGZ93_08425 [Enemella dayhoffiae]|uniref:Uncharacterized protein n=1 Tax=Enemella dayhoffiae TaxID=2016507 RepID=A0A255H2W5_9ACTN|nr:hypothetical protein [Enemella dayhoffiae]OYO21951.1 hypothetical protein CGZ93_08425 [Enemella dayhoffiae]